MYMFFLNNGKIMCALKDNYKISDHFYNLMNVLSELMVYMQSLKWLEIKI